MANKDSFIWLFAASGTVGATIGAFLAGWHDAIEGGQVVASIVEYPLGSPMHELHRKAWTLVNQIPAIPLRLGLPEHGVSMLLGALVGTSYFQAFSLITYSLSRAFLISLLMPMFLVATRAYWYAPDYDVIVFQATSGSLPDHTHGVLGLGIGLYFAALLSAGWFRSAGFVLGLTPAIHVTLGGWTILVTAICSFFVARWRVTGAGGGVPSTGVSSERHLQAFLDIWDTHRQPGISLRSVFHVLALVALVSAALVWRRDETREGTSLSLLFFAISGTAALVYYIAIKLAWDLVPLAFIQVIPGRFLDFIIAAGLPLVAGLMLSQRQNRATITILCVLFATPLLVKIINAAVSRGLTSNSLRIDAEIPTLVLVACCVAAIAMLRTPESLIAEGSPARDAITASAKALVLAIALSAVPLLIRTWIVHGSVGPKPFSVGEMVFWNEVRKDPGILVVPGGMPSAQIFSRRPLLIDAAALDFIPYVPEAAKIVEDILRDVYGIDYFDPPTELYHRGKILPDTARVAWEQRHHSDWQQLRLRYGLTAVLSPSDWTLDLPLLARAPGLTLYAVPPLAP